MNIFYRHGVKLMAMINIPPPCVNSTWCETNPLWGERCLTYQLEVPIRIIQLRFLVSPSLAMTET